MFFYYQRIMFIIFKLLWKLVIKTFFIGFSLILQMNFLIFITHFSSVFINIPRFGLPIKEIWSRTGLFKIRHSAIKALTTNVFSSLDNCIWIVSGKFFCYYDENTRYLQSTCYQAVLKSQIWLKITSNSVWLIMMKTWDKSAFLQLSAVFGTHQHVTAEGFSGTGFFVHLSNHVFLSQ